MARPAWKANLTPAQGDTPVAASVWVSRPGVTLLGMSHGTHVLGWVDRLDDMAVHTAETVLRETGALLPPTVHILAEDLHPPYVGYLTCRPFYRGPDARVAIAGLGLLPSALGATRLVVVWEHADLCTALEEAGESFPTGLVVLDARHGGGHTLRWHPMRMHLGPANQDGFTLVDPEWGTPKHHHDVELPGPVAQLLQVWRAPREWPELDLLQTYTRLEVAGFQMRWISRGTGPEQPGWARLLAPVIG